RGLGSACVVAHHESAACGTRAENERHLVTKRPGRTVLRKERLEFRWRGKRDPHCRRQKAKCRLLGLQLLGVRKIQQAAPSADARVLTEHFTCLQLSSLFLLAALHARAFHRTVLMS